MADLSYHAVKIYLVDIYGVKCPYPGGGWADMGSRQGEAFAEQSVNFIVCKTGDSDGDGWCDSNDCQPHNGNIYPGAPKKCSSFDNDCNGIQDSIELAVDEDGDGFMAAGSGSCASVFDCDDTNAGINPNMAERPFDGVDQNCNGAGDEQEILEVEWLGDANVCGGVKPPVRLPGHSDFNIRTGNVSHSQELFAAGGSALPVNFELHYDSINTYPGTMGVGWSHNYEIFLHENNDGTIVLTGGVNKRFYSPDGSGGYLLASDYSALTKKTDGAFSLRFRNGLVYEFNSAKIITSIRDRHGNTLQFDYSAPGQLTVTDPSKRSIVIHYDANGKIDWARDSALNQFDFTYNSKGLLGTVQYPEPVAGKGRPTWSYLYNDQGAMEYKTDPEGNIVYYKYDLNRRLITSVDPYGVKDTKGNLDSINLNGHSIKLEYLRYEPYAKPNIFPSVNSSTTTSTYLKLKDGSESKYTFHSDSLLWNDATYYMYEGDLVKQKSEPAQNGWLTTIYESYDPYGHPTRIKKGKGIPLSNGSNYFELYNSNILKDIELTYDNDNYDRLTAITNHLFSPPQTTDIDYIDQPNGGLEVIVTHPIVNEGDPTGPQSRFVYDALGRLADVYLPNGQEQHIGYTADGDLKTVTDAAGTVKEFSQINKRGLPEKVTMKALGMPDRVVELVYDSLGNTRQRKLTGSAQSEPGSPLISYITTFSYDLNGYLSGVTDAEGKSLLFKNNYRGQTEEISNYLGHKTDLDYSGSGCGTCGSQGSDKLSSLTDSKQNTTNFEYTKWGKLKKVTDSLDNAVWFSYNGEHLLRKYKWVDGRDYDPVLIAYSLDPLGRLTKKNTARTPVFVAGLAGISDDYTYYKESGLLKEASNNNVNYVHQYYDNGWIKQIDAYQPPGTAQPQSTIHYKYEQQNGIFFKKIITISVAGQPTKTVEYVTDPSTGRLQTINSAAGSFGIKYDVFSRRKTLAFPNDVVGTYSYHPDMDWLAGINYTHQEAGPNVLNISYPQYDKVGNQNLRVEDGAATGFKYDDLYQVTQAKTGPAEENFSWDEVGNRRSGPTVKELLDQTYSHDDANQMLQGRKYTYAYDDFGNQTYRYINPQKTKYWKQTWDVENRLTRAELIKDGQTVRTVSFKYDAFGRRIEKRVEGLAPQVPVPLTTTYVYDGEDIVFTLVSDGTTTTATHYVHGPGIDEPLAMVRNGQSYYYHADGLGSVVALTDSARAVVQRYKYDTFGMLTFVQDSEFGDAYGYTGREWDRELGLYYYRARYYDPVEGRFVSKDPIGIGGNIYNKTSRVKLSQYLEAIISPYGYTENDPVNRLDPYGLSSLSATERMLEGLLKLLALAEKADTALDAAELVKDSQSMTCAETPAERRQRQRDMVVDLINIGIVTPPFVDAVDKNKRNAVDNIVDRMNKTDEIYKELFHD